MKQLLLHEYFIVSDRNSYAFATCYHVIVSVSARSRGISSLHSCNKNKQKEIPALGLFFVHLKKGNYRRQRYSSRTPLIKLTLHWASLGMIWNLKPADLRRQRVKQFMIKTFGVFFQFVGSRITLCNVLGIRWSLRPYFPHSTRLHASFLLSLVILSYSQLFALSTQVLVGD